jgi:hypothetical protein
MGDMPERLHVNYEAGDGMDVEVYVDGKYVLGATREEIGSKGVAAVAGAARHVAAALAAPAPRPKLEIVRTDDGVSFYLNGKCLDETQPTRNACYAAESIAKELARALGADVDEVADPAPQPYVYFIAYRHNGGVGSVWHTRLTPIEDAAGEAESRAHIDALHPEFGGVVITNFICTDGPS